VLRTNRNLFSVKCGVGWHIPQSTNPCQTLSHLHFMTSFMIQNALKLCPSALTPNKLVWILFSRNTLLPLQTACWRHKTQDYILLKHCYLDHMVSEPGPHYVSLPLWKPRVKNLKIEITKMWMLHAGETYKYHCRLFINTAFNAKPLLCFSFFYFLIWNKKVKMSHKSSKPF